MLADKLRSAKSGITYDTITLVESGSAMLTLDNPVTFSTTLQEDDFVFLHYIANDDSVVTHPSGYTVIPVFLLDARSQSWYSYKKMSATPDTSFSITGVAGGSDGLSLTYYVFRGVDSVTPFDVTSVGIENINPSSITTVTDNSMVVVTTFTYGGGGTVSAAPSGYSDLEWKTATAYKDSITATALKTIPSSGTEDPGEFTFINTFDAYYSVTHALRPAIL